MSGRTQHTGIKNNRRRFWLLCLSVAPFLGPILLIRLLGTKAIVYDEWGLPWIFCQIKKGSLLLDLIWRGNHEHRLVFPRLLFCAVAVITRWDPRVVMYCSVLVMVVAWGLFLWAFLRQFGDGGLRSVISVGLSGLLIFSPVQQENWLWAFQFAFFLIIGCQLSALSLLMIDKLPVHDRIVGAGVLCVVASFSSAQGLFSWVALAPMIFAVATQTKYVWSIVTGWVLAAVLVWTIYLYGLDVSQSGGIRGVIAQPLMVLQFALVLISSPFIGGVPLGARLVIGSLLGPVILAISIFAFIALIRKLGWKPAAPLFSLALVGLFPWAAVSTGRLDQGSWVYGASRYTTPVIPTAIAVVLALCVLQSANPSSGAVASKKSIIPRLTSPTTATYVFAFLCLLFFGGYLWSLPNAIQSARAESQREKIADQFNLFSELLPDKIGGELYLLDSPENRHFDIHLIGLHDRIGVRILADGGYRPLVKAAVFRDDSHSAVGQIDKDSGADPSDHPDLIYLSGSFQIRSPDRYSPFVLVTVHGDSKVVGAQYTPALKRPPAAQQIPWELFVSRSLCNPQGNNMAFDAWVYDQTKKIFYWVGGISLWGDGTAKAPLLQKGVRDPN